MPPVQLFDLELDPGEKRNLALEQPDEVARLKALMSDLVRRGRSTPGAPQPYESPAEWRQLSWMTEAAQ